MSTNTPSLTKFFSLLIGIFLFFGTIIAYNEYILADGIEITLETAPVDPRDILRGDYVILRYDFESDDKLTNFLAQRSYNDQKSSFYISFSQEDPAQILSISEEKPKDAAFLRVQQKGLSNIETGIAKYFVPEGTGLEIEKIRGNMSVKIKVTKNGSARILDLYYKGERIIPKTFKAPRNF